MNKKKAFVFDTNFIIENINLSEVVKNLNENFTVYVTQISIDERISQKYLLMKKIYDNLSEVEVTYKDIAKITVTTPFEKKFEREEKITQKGYNSLFGNNIISFSPDETTLAKIIDRVHKKLPPFSSVDGASDKGFKDTLIWISLLNYFRDNGEDEIIFVTNDNGFRKYAEELCKEFNKYTEKNIVIKDNIFYKSIKTNESESPLHKDITPLPDVNHLREKIYNTISSLIYIEKEDYWGGPYWDKTFSLNKKVDSAYMEIIFERLKQDITEHILELEIPAAIIFGRIDDRVTNGTSIPMEALENALALYEEIKENYPEYLSQFYNAAASIINENYVEPQEPVNDSEMPF